MKKTFINPLLKVERALSGSWGSTKI